MSIFADTSRYRFAEVYEATDRTGRKVLALTAAEPPAQRILGEHLRSEGERLDLIAGFYLDDPAAFWRLALANDVLTPDTIAQAASVSVPSKR
nr:hypothetical protein [uncultured bacterium]